MFLGVCLFLLVYFVCIQLLLVFLFNPFISVRSVVKHPLSFLVLLIFIFSLFSVSLAQHL